MSIDSLHFRDALGSLDAGVSVVTARHQNEAIGITVSSFTSLSLTPPLILFCLDLKSKSKAAFAPRKTFAVNLLSQEQKSVAQHFAQAGKKSWDTISFEENKLGVRIIKKSIVSLACTVTKQHKSGDHVIIIAKVDAVSHVDKQAQPLLYFRRHYHDLGGITE
ncbi:MAG: flavin reductase family protein [Alphaproteobacteria bacterium]|nr:flavin reductase family protein [Alphaproteobacteria bacterium]